MTELPALLQECYRDKLAMVLALQAGARLVRSYDANNAYQYWINRGDVQLSWIRSALEDLGAAVPESGPEPARAAAGQAGEAETAVLREDAAASAAFVARWTPRVEAMANARHRKMLRVILGEIVEQQRALDQALAGRTDVLGRHNPRNPAPSGEVLASRWIE
jgi:hypothetical protein